MIFLMGISIMACIYAACILFGKISALKGICVGISGYFFLYVFCCALLFWIDCFSIFNAVVFSFALSLAGAVFQWKKKKGLPELVVSKQELLMFGLVLCIVIPFTIHKFDFFGMGQDQGVYQTKAIELINGNNERIFDFPEFAELETEEQISSYYQNIVKLLGYDLYTSDMPTLSESGKGSAVSGIFHGIPTFPAILALFGKLFGVSHMQECQSLFLVLVLLLLFYAMENLNIGGFIKIILVLVFGMSPLMIWVAKSSLTEMFLALILIMYVLLLTEENVKLKCLSCVPLIIFAFYHVSIYTMMPLFVLIYWGLFLLEDDKRYIKVCNITVVMYFLGFLFMAYISPVYTINNYVLQLKKIPFINYNTIMIVVAAVSFMALAVNNFLVLKIGSKYSIRTCIFNHINWQLIYRVCMGLLLIGFIAVSTINIINGKSMSSMTLIVYTIASGVILLPMILIKIFFKEEKRKDSNIFLISVVFLYTIIVYSVCLRQTTSFYYYTRYLSPFLSIIYIMFGVLYFKLKKWKIIVIGGICACSYFQADMLLLNDVDDSRIQWNIVEDILEISVEEDSAIIVSDALSQTFFLPLDSKGYNVYNQWADFDEEISFLFDRYTNIYYVSNEALPDNEEEFQIIYRSDNIASEDIGIRPQKYLGYPLEFSKINSTITVYKTSSEKLSYDINAPDFQGTGFGTIEGDFAWTSSNVTINCWLEEKSYHAIISQGPGIPFTELEIDSLNLDVYVNDTFLKSILIDENNNGEDLSFDIPQNYILDGNNIFTIKCATWSPQDYGLNDSREIGFAFQELNLQPISE